ncbi:MAG: ABC transporter ATP-binding protein [Candidatus Omnitrophica bacterium]|nr:ABC transporter ATP-binding protein [Candidatus Omnitrophota bacterium]
MAETASRPSERPAYVEARHVSKRFQHDGKTLEVLRDVTLSIHQGEFVCLLGPSGCGKTTFVHMIAGLDRPDEGEILLEGQPIRGPGFDRVVVFQDAALFPWLTVQANVEFGLRMMDLPKPTRRERALEHLKLVHLSRFVNAYPHQLSGGMRQRVAIARALAMNPKILLMDEPFGALDAQTRAVMQEELLGLWAQTRKTVFLVTHNVREATGLADRVYEISARPSSIKRVYKIDLPRPRQAADPVLLGIQRRILQSLGEEVAKVMQEEFGEVIRVPEARDEAPADRALGMHI